MKRLVKPELLDELPAADPRAEHSRRDLRLLNRIMGHAGIVGGAIARTSGRAQPRRVVELGGGDGTFLLRVAGWLPQWQAGHAGCSPTPTGGPTAFLLDRQVLVRAETQSEFSRLGWQIEPVQCDVFDWLAKADSVRADLMLANLFLHHFDPDRLRHLLKLVASRTNLLIACEPRRSRFALGAASLVGLLGCHPVTQHDAVASVRAGFRTGELSGCWPDLDGWHLHESERGLFSHLFVARRMSN